MRISDWSSDVCSSDLFASIGGAGSLISWWASWALLGMGWAFISPPIWTAAIAPRFDRGRGLALAITLCGGGVTLILAPLLARWSIELIGWRQIGRASGR